MEAQMKGTRKALLFFLLVISLAVAGQTEKTDRKASFEITKRASQTIQHLADLGMRHAGTENETKALEYIKKRLEELGMETIEEPFTFDQFTLKEAKLQIGEASIDPTLVGINPYNGRSTVEGDAIVIKPSTPREEIFTIKGENKIFLTSKPVNFFQLAYLKPKAIVFVDEKELESLIHETGSPALLSVDGEIQHMRSTNVVATLFPKTDTEKEVILSAHVDSYNGPGADDNASGVAVLLELAEYFSKRKKDLTYRLKFIAFGSEEVGMLGSKAYVAKHQEELKNCELVFNIDTVGGNEGVYVEMRGDKKNRAEVKGKSLFPEEMVSKAGRDFGEKWILLHPSQVMYNAWIPEWLRAAIEESGKELGYEINPSYMMGSDHRSFALAGITSTGISITGNKHHSPEDTPEKINTESLQKAGRIVSRVIEKIMSAKKEAPN
jgi:Iap family predicted aminopeptidase